MQATTHESGLSIFGLVRELREETRMLIKQEIELAKAEISEKTSKMGRNATYMGIGGFVAYAGGILLLAGLGALAGFGLEQLGLDRLLAFGLGMIVMGVITAVVGYIFIQKSIKAFSSESLAPRRTINTIKHPTNSSMIAEPEIPKESGGNGNGHRRSSSEIQSSINALQGMMHRTTGEIRERLTPHHMKEVVKNNIKTHPVRSGIIGAATGLMGYLVVRKKMHHNGHTNGHH